MKIIINFLLRGRNSRKRHKEKKKNKLMLSKLIKISSKKRKDRESAAALISGIGISQITNGIFKAGRTS
jgi:hypothetical protein